jgi:hypothetical protein
VLLSHILSKTTAKKIRASWTAGDADNLSWIIKNGQVVYGPIFSSVVDRGVEFSHDSAMVAVEVHDFADSTVPIPLQAEPNTRPTLSWNGIDGTEKYYVYHQEAGETEELLAEIDGRDAETYYYKIPSPLNGVDGVWHFFRVESVDEYENESVRQSWRLWVYDLPETLSGITIENGSAPGLFDITIEEET